MSKPSNRIHLSYEEKYSLLSKTLSPVGAYNIAKELDSLTFSQLREIRDAIKEIAKGKKPTGQLYRSDILNKNVTIPED